jgi:phosphate transport system substrate-binding protein
MSTAASADIGGLRPRFGGLSRRPSPRSPETARPRAWRFRGRVLALLTALSVSTMAVLGFATAAGASSPTLQSTGSSFAGVAIQQWVGQAATLYGLNINWQVSSSVIGLDDFAQSQIDFAASDIPYSSDQASNTPNFPYEYMPDVAGALAFMYNLLGSNGQRITDLVLDAQVLDEIFTGQITTWNSPAIAELNPQLDQCNGGTCQGDLPDTTILPVYRDDASGENYLLSSYLLQMDNGPFVAYQTAMAAAYVGQPSATWPTPVSGQPIPPGYPGWTAGNLVGQQGSDNLANYVSAASSNGAIGYAETAYAIEHTMPVASIINQSGNAVQPTSVNDATALEKAILYSNLTQNLSGVFTNTLANAYPVSAYSYLVTPCAPNLAVAQKPSTNCSIGENSTTTSGTSSFPADKGQALGQFISFMACAGQEKMALLGYSPLPPNLVDEDFDAVGRLNGGVQPPPATAANCQNPYVDGQTPLPGEPKVEGGLPPPGPGGRQSDIGGGGGGGASTVGGGTPTGNGSTTPGSATTSGGSTPGAGSSVPGSVGKKGTGGRSSKGSSSNGGVSAYLNHIKKSGPGQGPNSFILAAGLRGAAGGILGVSSPVGLVLIWCAAFVFVLFMPALLLSRRRRKGRAPGAPGGLAFGTARAGSDTGPGTGPGTLTNDATNTNGASHVEGAGTSAVSDGAVPVVHGKKGAQRHALLRRNRGTR